MRRPGAPRTKQLNIKLDEDAECLLRRHVKDRMAVGVYLSQLIFADAARRALHPRRHEPSPATGDESA